MIIASKTLEAMAITSLNTCKDAKMGKFLAHMMMPALILRTFSCELILKSLVAKAHGNFGNTHKLSVLYHLVDQPTKVLIAEEVIRKMRVYNTNYGESDFFSDLDNITRHFIDWRCFVMRPESLKNIYFETLFNVLIDLALTPKYE